MTKKDDRRALQSVRILREQEWAYDARVGRHLSIREVSLLSYRSRDEGGLGYGLSPSAISGLVNGYAERMRDALEESPALRIQQELADLDMQYRAAAQLTGYSTGEKRISVVTGEEFDVLRDERVILGALQRMESIGARRAKLLGLDVVQAQKVDVTVKDAASAELEAMLAEAGLK